MKKVITYGTFDLFHKGHYNIIKRARALGDYLIVGVTSESYDIERGKLNVRDSLIKRIENVRRTELADEIIIEEYQGQKVNDIIKYDIDILVVGSDWRGKFDYLKNYCDVVYLERTKNISSTKLRGEGVIFNMGVVTDDIRDNDFVQESKYVSGVHVERVFSEDEETARDFCDKYELDSWWNDYDEFLSGIDIVYIKCRQSEREQYIERAIDMGKYVISDVPAALSPEKLRYFFRKAAEHKVVLIERLTLVYLRAFTQLVWLVHSNLVGDLVSVVTDDIRDNDFVQESKYVSGVHVERVFSEDEETARDFCDKYELDSWWNDYDEFLSGIDIVYIKCRQSEREQYIERAIDMGKYVISDVPAALSPEKLRYFFRKAAEHKVVLIERLTLVYLRAFTQLVWLVHSNLVGDLVSVKCAISQDDFEGGKPFNETVCNAICAVIKILGKNCREVNTNAVTDRQGKFVYDMITIKYENALATIEIGTTVDVEDEMVIIGSNGRVTIPNDWWNTGYFEANISGREFLKRYSFNFDGNGFRYLLQELMIMIRDKRTECTRLFYDESVKLLEVLETINQKG